MIDQGGHATRSVVFDALGKVICSAESAIKTISRNNLEVEHDPVDLLNSVYASIEQVSQILGDDYSKIVKAGIATQRSSIVCWDKKTGKALSPVISWQDRRTTNDIVQYQEHSQYIHDVTGLYLNPHYGATKMRWCLNNLPEVKKAFEADNLCIAPMASFILFHLLDNTPFVVDPANASRSLMMNYKTLSWQPELLVIFTVPESTLPKIIFTKDAYGNIDRHSHKIPLELCTGDQSAAIYSEGQLLNDEVFVNAGTGAFVLKASDGVPDLKKEKLLASVVFANANKSTEISYVIEGTVNGAGRALQWFSECENILDYESHLDEWCAEFDDPPIFINAISGIGSPYWVAEFNSYFTKEGSNESKFVGVLESIVFLISENIKCIQNISGDIKRIRIAGGITNSKAFCQKLSNLLKTEVVLAQELEATARGVFYLLSGCQSKSTTTYSAMFHPKNDQMLYGRFVNWRKIMKNSFLSRA